MSVINTALSGLEAAQTRLNVSANNTANQLSTYGEDATGAPVNAPYQPQQVQNQSLQNGGVQPVTLLSDPASIQLYDPSSSVADANGLVNYPNVRQDDEAVNRLLAAQAYKANLSVLKTEEETTSSLLDISVS
jgi:flagellar basal body rod protein FlgC